MDNFRDADIDATRFWDTLLLEFSHRDVPIVNVYLEALLYIYLHVMSCRTTGNRHLLDRLSEMNVAKGRAAQDSLIVRWRNQVDPLQFSDSVNHAFWIVRDVLSAQTHRDRLIVSNDTAAFQRFEFAAVWLTHQDESLVMTTFDLGLARFGAQMADPAREAFCARLAAALAPRSSATLVDMFGVTGQFSIQTSSIQGAGAKTLTPERHDELGLVLAMRFDLGSIDHEILPSPAHGHGLLHWPHHVDLALFNAPVMARRDELYSLDGSRPWGRSPSSLSFAYSALSTESRFDLMLVVVPQIDAQSKNWQYKLRKELVDRERLVAVVDLPKNASMSGRARLSAWLIQGARGRPFTPDKRILFIDAEPLTRLTFSESGKAAAAFIAQLVRMQTDHKVFDGLQIEQSGKGEHLLQTIFAREFSEGYKNVPGLCQAASKDEVAANDFSLVAHRYVQEVLEVDFLTRVERAKLNACLGDPLTASKRIYVIGNNGEGKSILLREVAEQSAALKRKVVAIASGASDRFPRSLKGDGAPFYTYMGARTSVAGVNIRDTAVNAGRLMLAIHEVPEKKEAFDEIAHLVGFESEQYLIPASVGKNAHADRGILGGVVRLDAVDPIDRGHVVELRQSTQAMRKFKLGLKRKLDRGTITPFDELSSGEQQIFMLAAKMVLHADAGTLFLVDEPEISMHVSWQRAIPKIFMAVGRKFDADVLVATHSPILISTARETDDFCFTLRDGSVQPLEPESRRSVETALFEGFRTYTTNNREVHERCASLVAEFIDIVNRDDASGNIERDILSRLSEMKRIVEDGRSFEHQEVSDLDIDLIEKAQAAIREIRNFQENQY